MFHEDARSVTIDIPKPRVYAKASNIAIKKERSERVTQKVVKKPTDVSINRYNFPSVEPIGLYNIIKREDMLLPYKLYSQQQSRDKQRQLLTIHINERYKIISSDLRMRLHVSDPNDDGLTKAFDEKHHRVYDRICVNNKNSFKTLKYVFSKQLRARQVIGYRKDTITNINNDIAKENEMFNISFERYKAQVKYFDEFVASDYNKSMEFLSKWEQSTYQLLAKIVELQNLASEKSSITSKILGLDYKYRLQQKYGRFLYYISPPSWRSHHREFARSVEIEAKGFDFGINNEEDTFNIIFERLQRELSTGIIKPPLYFTHPSDLMEVFETIEKQNLNYFIHVARMEPHSRSLINAVRHLRDLVAQDSAAVATTISGFKDKLQFSEENCALLQAKFLKIINGTFYDSVGAPDVLKLNLHLEFVYENVFKEKPTNIDMMNIARALEIMYIEYNKLLDDMHSDKVHQAVVQLMNEEKMKLKRAKAAARELRNYEKMQRALLRAHTTISKSIKKLETVLTCPSKRKPKGQITKKQSERVTSQIDLTDAEVEYLALFTDWTGHEDPSKYIHRLTFSEENENFKSKLRH